METKVCTCSNEFGSRRLNPNCKVHTGGQFIGRLPRAFEEAARESIATYVERIKAIEHALDYVESDTITRARIATLDLDMVCDALLSLAAEYEKSIRVLRRELSAEDGILADPRLVRAIFGKETETAV